MFKLGWFKILVDKLLKLLYVLVSGANSGKKNDSYLSFDI